MKRSTALFYLLSATLYLLTTGAALACPACKDAISSSDPKGYTRLTKGYARSIYLLWEPPIWCSPESP